MNLTTKPQPVNDALFSTANRTNYHRKTPSRMDLLQANPSGFVRSHSSNKAAECNVLRHVLQKQRKKREPPRIYRSYRTER